MDLVDRFKRELNLKFKNLRDFPRLYPKSVIKNQNEYRQFYARGYVFLYAVDEKEKSVLISRIYHQKSDYQNMYE